MAIVHLKMRDKKKRNLYGHYELKRKELLSIRNNLHLHPLLRYHAQYQLDQLPKNSSICRIKNRCIETLRDRAVYRDFGLSRITFRDFVGRKYIPGVKKSSW